MRPKPTPLPSGLHLVAAPEEQELRNGWTGDYLFSFSAKKRAVVIVSDGFGWEHVSIHIQKRNERGRVQSFTPTWADMAFFKDLFWEPTETVMQLHVPAADHVNNHPNVLHLWRPIDQDIPLPPQYLV